METYARLDCAKDTGEDCIDSEEYVVWRWGGERHCIFLEMEKSTASRVFPPRQAMRECWEADRTRREYCSEESCEKNNDSLETGNAKSGITKDSIAPSMLSVLRQPRQQPVHPRQGSPLLSSLLLPDYRSKQRVSFRSASHVSKATERVQRRHMR